MVAQVFGLPDAGAYYEDKLGVRPYALFALGSDLVEGSDFAVGEDLMGGLPLVATGVPVDGGAYATTADDKYWTTSFTGNTLVDAEGPDVGGTLIAVARRAAGVNATMITNFPGAGTSMSLSLSSGALAQSILQPNVRVASLPNDLNRGARFGMYAMTVTPIETVIHERHAGIVLQSSALAFAMQAIGGTAAFNIGNRGDLVADWVDIAVAAFFSRKLTAAEVDGCYDFLADWTGLL